MGPRAELRGKRSRIAFHRSLVRWSFSDVLVAAKQENFACTVLTVSQEFVAMVSQEVAWHDERRARIRNNHPEVRELYGPDPRTQLAILGVVGGHFAVARSLAAASFGPWLGATLVIGPTLAHAIGVLIHEATHNLVAQGGTANKVWGLVLNLPLGAPAATEFRQQHLLHHRHLAETDQDVGRDTQAPTWAEDAWVGTSSWRKLVSFTAGRFYWKGRPANKVPFDGWMIANWVTSFGAITVVAIGWGAAPALYLLCSSLLAFGPHPFGARRLSEHLPVREEQPTNSYYGPLNAVSFNVGYHVEHHDFPNIPWTRIKQLKQLARDEYEELFAFRSWSKLIASYFWDARYRVGHYVGLRGAMGEDIVEPAQAEAKSSPTEPSASRGGRETAPGESGFFTKNGRGRGKPERAA